MKIGNGLPELDEVDLQILTILQDHGRVSHVKLAEQVGLSPPSVIERVKKLEDGGIITGYHAAVDAKRLGKNVTAFIGVLISHPKAVARFEEAVGMLDDVLECHHVTGEHSALVKVKTWDTSSLEDLISAIRSIEGVTRTETMVVLSSHIERCQITVGQEELHRIAEARRHRHAAGKPGALEGKRA